MEGALCFSCFDTLSCGVFGCSVGAFFGQPTLLFIRIAGDISGLPTF
jgi:hypothetical protein